jgi:hypothetical protein
MARRVRWALLALLVLVAGAVAAVALAVHPDLTDARDRVDAAWTPLRAPLQARYTALGGLHTALATAAADRPVTVELGAALDRWRELAARGDERTDAGREATTANELEALARRARANVVDSGRLQADPAVTAALGAYDQAVVPEPAVRTYNRAVEAYERERRGTIQRVVASPLGFDGRPRLLLG